MYPSIFLYALVFLNVDTRTGAVPSADVKPLQCNVCNTTKCDQVQSVICPPDRPFCGTEATAPNFTNSLVCRAAQEATCILEHKAKQFQLTCICYDNLCNAPYNQRLRNELINFSNNFSGNGTAKLTETFFKLPAFANVSNEVIYEKLISNATAATSISTLSPTAANFDSVKATTHANYSNEILPRAEALKHEATVPPDDDEDENEGSGTSIDESKRHEHASPAAPSSYLPANDNNAPCTLINTMLIITLYCFHILI